MLPPTLPTIRATLVSLLLAAVAFPAVAEPVEVAWCTGLSPISWGFSVVPPAAATEVRLSVVSDGVRLVSCVAGPGLPADWTVTTEGLSVTARGATPLEGGVRRDAFLVVETNRGTGHVDGNGARGVEWEAELGVSGPEDVTLLRTRVVPPGMLELPDAVSRGLVLVALRPRGPLGPVEITVDNPTLQPLWLDLPPGQVLSGDGQDWIVSLVRPYRLLRKQKLGRTVTAFPVRPPPPGTPAPRRLAWGERRHARTADLIETALVVERLQQEVATGARWAGPLEHALPFDFWPLVVQWSFWLTGDDPPPFDTLTGLVAGLVEGRTASGDPHAASLDVQGATREVELMTKRVIESRAALPPEPGLSLDLQAAFSRSR